MKKISANLIYKLIITFLCASISIVIGLTMTHLKNYLFWIILIGFLTLCIADIILDSEKYNAIFKFLFFLIVLASFAIIGYSILYHTHLLDKFNNVEELRKIILKTEHWGVIVFIILTILQVVILPIPAAVTIVLGVVIYGPLWAAILSSIGTILGSIVCFLLGKIFGKKLVIWMIGEEKTQKYSEILNKKGKIPFIIMMIFPFFPDDILCMIAGITSMTYKFFLITIGITRPIVIFVIAFLGSGKIIPFSGWGIPVWIALFCVLVVLGLIINNFINKHIKSKEKEQHIK